MGDGAGGWWPVAVGPDQPEPPAPPPIEWHLDAATGWMGGSGCRG